MKISTLPASPRVTLFTLLLLFISYSYGMQYHFKSLQGDPSEFESFTLPSNQDSAAQTSATSIPIKFNTDHIARTSFFVDSDSQFGFCAMSPLADEFEYAFTLPGSSHPLTLDQVLLKFDGNITTENVGIGLAALYSSICYQFTGAIIGEWKVTVTLTQGSLKRESGIINSIGYQVHSDVPTGYFLVFNESPYKLRAYSSYGAVRGDHMQLNSELLDSNTGLRFMSSRTEKNSPITQAVVLNPYGGQITVDMHDDGLHADLEANDGFYGGHFLVNDTGVYQITTFMDGYTSSGVKFQRSVDNVIRAIKSNVSLEENTAIATTDGDFLNIKLKIRGQQDNSDEIVAYAQVWGKSLNGTEDVAIAWISGISKAELNDEDDEIYFYGLDLNIQWIVKAQAQAPFTLRQVRVQDRGILALLDTIDELPVEFNGTITEHPLYKIHPSKIVVTEEMHSGRRPDQYRRDLKRDGTNGKKILVHGYCSDALAWPLSNFTDALLFQDPNANRKIDEFARLVLQFANDSNVDSFSLIAHSQGGLVSLHIHTYYWSGMDLATGGYLIQSVGSPYHGTVMAGLTASIGWVFGYGCGANDDLTPEGAEAWLAGIPQDKQAAVHFYTTDGTNACSLPSNWVGLELPNDGVVAESFGQLEYANNEGNYDGWCHTSAMSSPFQCMDVDRNAIIDASAAL